MLENFRHETKRWQSEIDFWKVEGQFFKRLLDIYSLKISDDDDRLAFSSFEEKLKQYIEKIMDNLKKEIHLHEEYLTEIIDKKAFSEEYTYKLRHEKLAKSTAALKKEFVQFKERLYKFTDTI
ncbi:MAG: hypothetical protein POELPBGB_01025 [Bacteroidia bacterium]|nr:hypothetical protein [Bacteroidia bacterium]